MNLNREYTKLRNTLLDSTLPVDTKPSELREEPGGPGEQLIIDSNAISATA